MSFSLQRLCDTNKVFDSVDLRARYNVETIEIDYIAQCTHTVRLTS